MSFNSANNDECPTSFEVIIVGSGLAGWNLAKQIRRLDTSLSLLMICADAGHGYSKPMLSNALDKGKSFEDLIMQSVDQLREQLKIEIWSETKVQSINASEKCLETSRGSVKYHSLVLAVGARPRTLPLQGDAVDALWRINDLYAYGRFREKLADLDQSRLESSPAESVSPTSIAILGAGLVGCEFANDLVSAGYSVQVFDTAAYPFSALLPESVGFVARDQLSSAGVEFHFETAITEVHQCESGFELRDQQGAGFQADIVISAVGLVSNTELAISAGLDVDLGIVVDSFMQTSDPAIFAVGDCVSVQGRPLRYILPLMASVQDLAKTLTGVKTSVQYPVMPILVKTPACPMLIAHSALDEDGDWRLEINGCNGQALCYDSGLKLVNFVLLGDAIKEKQSWLKRLYADTK